MPSAAPTGARGHLPNASRRSSHCDGCRSRSPAIPTLRWSAWSIAGDVATPPSRRRGEPHCARDTWTRSRPMSRSTLGRRKARPTRGSTGSGRARSLPPCERDPDRVKRHAGAADRSRGGILELHGEPGRGPRCSRDRAAVRDARRAVVDVRRPARRAGRSVRPEDDVPAGDPGAHESVDAARGCQEDHRAAAGGLGDGA